MIEIDHLVKRFGDLTAVNDISLTVKPGEFFCVLGPNAAGKTTTIRMLAGLIKPTSGSARIAGFDVQTIRYLNCPGVLGWWLNSRVLRRRVLPRGQLAVFRWIQPLLTLEEKRDPPFGMSLLVLATRHPMDETKSPSR